jgi:hypothetical protein
MKMRGLALGFPGSRNSEVHLLRERGKVNSWIYYNGSIFKVLTPTLECAGISSKKVAFGKINRGIAQVKLDVSILWGTDSYPELIHSIH